MIFYSNAISIGNKILVRGYENGEPFKEKVDFNPTLYVTSKHKNSKEMMRTLDGEVVYAFSPGNIKDTRDFIERYESVEGFKIYGNLNYAYQYISDIIRQKLLTTKTKLNVSLLILKLRLKMGSRILKQRTKRFFSSR